MQRASVCGHTVGRDSAYIDLDRRRFFYLCKGLYRLAVHVGSREREGFPSDPGIFVIAPLAPIFLLHLLGVDAREDFLYSERGFVERAKFTAAGFSSFCHDLNASILDAHSTLISDSLRTLL
jgi:hypothetical protein